MPSMIFDPNLGLTFPDGSALSSAVQLGMRNLLINANAAINQRAYVSGAATGAANQYTVDRWRVVVPGQGLAFAASGNGNVMTAPAGGLEQVIEGANIGITAGVINWVGTATCTVDGVAKTKGQAVTLIPGTNCSVKFFGNTVSLPQIEAGPVPTPFEFRSIGTELALCKRYFQWVPFNMRCYSSATGNSQETVISWPEMRITPTVSALAADPYIPQSSSNNASNQVQRATPYGGSLYLLATAASTDTFVLGYRCSLTAEL